MKTIEMSEQEGIKIKTTVVDATANVLVVEINGYVDQANCHAAEDYRRLSGEAIL